MLGVRAEARDERRVVPDFRSEEPIDELRDSRRALARAEMRKSQSCARKEMSTLRRPSPCRRCSGPSSTHVGDGYDLVEPLLAVRCGFGELHATVSDSSWIDPRDVSEPREPLRRREDVCAGVP